MTFSEKFRFNWWAGTLVLLSIAFIARAYQLYPFSSFAFRPNALDTILALSWIVLVLVPIFSEISFAGLTVKRQIDEAKKEILGAVTSVVTNVRHDTHIHYPSASDFKTSEAVSMLDEVTKNAVRSHTRSTETGQFTDEDGELSHSVDAKTFTTEYIADAAVSVEFGVIKRKLERAVRELTKRKGVPLPDQSFNRDVTKLSLMALIPVDLVTPLRVLHSVCVANLNGTPLTDSQIAFVRDNQKDLINSVRHL